MELVLVNKTHKSQTFSAHLLSQVLHRMVICVLMVSLRAAETMRSISMLTHRVWKIWTHSHRVLMGTESSGHRTVPKRICLI